MNDVDRPADPASVHPGELRSPLGSRAKSLLIVLLCLGLLGGLGWYFSHRNAQNGPPGGGFGGGRGRASATVAFAVAARADVPIKVEALGTVTPIATAVVRPQVSGVIKEIFFQEGQTVKSGQPLVQIDPRPFKLAIDQARAQLARDDAELDNARVILERNQTLLAQDSIAKQDVQTQEATVKQLIGVVAADQAAVETAQLNLTYSKVVAPISGRIGLRPVDLGNYVTAGDANGVATITQLQPIDVVFTLPADNVIPVEKRLSAGAQLPTTVLDRTRTQQLGMGQFLTLDNQIDSQTGTVRAKARFDNPDGVLFPNQFVNVQLQLDTVKQAIVVPAAAIRHGPQGEFVYVIAQDNTAHVREVKTGVALDDRASVTSGLEVGERVVTEGGDRLADGSTVRLPGQQRPEGAPGGKWKGGQGGPQNAQGQRRHKGDAQGAPGASDGSQQIQQPSEQAATQGQSGERRRSHRAAAQDAG